MSWWRRWVHWRKRWNYIFSFHSYRKKNKEALKNYKKLWKESKRQIKVINGDEPIKYKKDFMKIKFESDDNLPLGKTFSISDIIIVAVSVLEKDGKFYPQIFLDECVYKL